MYTEDLKKVGWRLSNRKEAAKRKGIQNLKDFGISEQKQIESIMKMQGLI